MQFAFRTSKASRPRRAPGTALPVRKAARVQAVTHFWLNLPYPAKLGRTQSEAATALDLHSPAATGLPSTQPPSTNKCENFLSLSLEKKKIVNVTGEAEKLQSGCREGPVVPSCWSRFVPPIRACMDPRKEHWKCRGGCGVPLVGVKHRGCLAF